MRLRHAGVVRCLAMVVMVLLGRGVCLGGVAIVKEGAPRATIIVARGAINAPPTDKSAAKVNAAAKELQLYVGKISGATLPIAADDAAPAGALILVGRSTLTDAMNVRIPSGHTTDGREEGFVVFARGDRLLLAGNDEGRYHGTQYAVYCFLHTLGVRWFMPGEFGEVVPHTRTIDVRDQEVRQTPTFAMRDWWGATSPEVAALARQWKLRNFMNPDPGLAMPTDGSTAAFCADASQAATHPELFARAQDGTADTHMPNLSNPKAVETAIAKMKEALRKVPDDHTIGLAPDDGIPRDFSPGTLKLNQGFTDVRASEGVDAGLAATEEWIQFINQVARGVRADFPDAIITTNGYSNRNTPPQGMDLEPNIGVMFAAIWCDTLHAYDDPKSWQSVRQGQMIQRWCQLSKHVFIYGYLYNMFTSGLAPIPTVRKLARDFPLMKKWGVYGFSDEGFYVWMESGIATWYVRAALEWNADANVNDILDDYYSKWYGPAAKPARAFWDDLEEAMESTPILMHEDRALRFVYSDALVKSLERHLAKAEKAADAEPFKTHVRVDRLTLEHLKAYLAMWDAEFAADFAGAAAQIDRMMDCRKQLNAIDPVFCMPDEGGASGVWCWGVLERQKYYRRLADRVSGKTGDLVCVLPEKAAFTTDPHDEGRFAEWYAPSFDVGSWKKIPTTKSFYLNGYLDPHGYPYTGVLWYRLEVDVPAKFQGRSIHLNIPAVETETPRVETHYWLWTNGQYNGYQHHRNGYLPDSESDWDITAAVHPGKKNVFVVRVDTKLNRSQAVDGLRSRLFLYSPVEAGASH